MPNPGFRIKKSFVRPPKDLVAQFAGMPAANIGDIMFRASCVDTRIKPYNKSPLLGVAFTVKVRAGDNLMLHKAIDMAQPGDILVVDAHGDDTYAIVGDLMISWSRRRGLGGMVVDGCVRDVGEVSGLTDFPVYAAGVNPNGPLKEGYGEINFPIVFGGIAVNPGDILVGDEDGIVVIKPEDALDVLEKTRAIMAKEASIKIDIQNLAWDRAWVDKTLQEKGCLFIE